jgi:hypothetical protein
MTGSQQGEERGIIPRAMEELLEQSQAMMAQGWEVSLSVSIVELYNEDLRDLLRDKDINQSQSSSSSTSTRRSRSSMLMSLPSTTTADKGMVDGKDYKIVRNPQDGSVSVSGLSSHQLPMASSSSLATDTSMENAATTTNSMAAFQALLSLSQRERVTASTGMNEQSSRSHLVVLVDVLATLAVSDDTKPTSSGNGNPTNGSNKERKSVTKVLRGGLRLCDLAGSERLDRTQTLYDAARLKETVNINKSLSCLADVFLALSNKASHVPYRNSKLTMLLQDCLSGEGKALMFVNVSPTAASAPETLCSLRFANQVSQVELGKAVKNVVTTTSSVVSVAAPPMPNNNNNNNKDVVSQLHPALQVDFKTVSSVPVSAAGSASVSITATTPVGVAEPATPRPDRAKMRSSLTARQSQEAAPSPAATAAATVERKRSHSLVPFAASASSNSNAAAVTATSASVAKSSSRSVRFAELEPILETVVSSKERPASTTATVVAATAANGRENSNNNTNNVNRDNKPLQMYSFLSQSQPERPVGTAPRVRGLLQGGAARRTSVVSSSSQRINNSGSGSALLSSTSTSFFTTSSSSSMSSKENDRDTNSGNSTLLSSFTANLVGGGGSTSSSSSMLMKEKEKDRDVDPSTTSTTTRRKRESVCFDLSVTNTVVSTATAAKRQRGSTAADEPFSATGTPWGLGSVGRKSSWR